MSLEKKEFTDHSQTFWQVLCHKAKAVLASRMHAHQSGGEAHHQTFIKEITGVEVLTVSTVLPCAKWA